MPFMNEITSFFTGLALLIGAIGTVVITGFKVYKNTMKEISDLPNKIKKQSSVDVIITQAMEELKEFIQADRVQIFDFHNGGHYANGRSALKTTCTYEVVRAGVESVQSHLQGIALSCIPRFINKLLTDGKIEVTDVEDIETTMPSSYALKKDQGIMSFYDIIINNKQGEPVGFLAVQYTECCKTEFTEKDKQCVLKLKFLIEQQLEEMILKK